jgi:hypothetical protein
MKNYFSPGRIRGSPQGYNPFIHPGTTDATSKEVGCISDWVSKLGLFCPGSS